MVTDDSAEAPNAGSASASRMTLMGGRAVHDACIAAREQWSGPRRTTSRRHRTSSAHRPRRRSIPTTGAGRPNYCYGYAAQAVEVEVNTLTGQVQVLAVISVHDVGARSTGSRSRGRSRAAWRRRSATRCWKTCKCATATS